MKGAGGIGGSEVTYQCSACRGVKVQLPSSEGGFFACINPTCRSYHHKAEQNRKVEQNRQAMAIYRLD